MLVLPSFRLRAALGGGVSPYWARMLGLFGSSILGYWPLWDEVGAITAVDISGNARHGTPTNCVFGTAGIGDGKTSVSMLIASASRVNLLTPLQLIFPSAEGSILVWGQTATWGQTNKSLLDFNVNASNRVRAYCDGGNNITCRYVAGGTTESVTATPGPTTAWWHLALTWSVMANLFTVYLNGASVGASGTLGTWVGASLAEAFWGYESTNTWTGNLAHGILLNRAATPAEALKASVV